MNERELVMETRGYESCDGQKINRILTKQEAFMLHEINISFMSKGCIVRVGCKTFAFSSTDEAFLELQKYFEEPLKTQERWTKVLSTI